MLAVHRLAPSPSQDSLLLSDRTTISCLFNKRNRKSPKVFILGLFLLLATADSNF